MKTPRKKYPHHALAVPRAPGLMVLTVMPCFGYHRHGSMQKWVLGGRKYKWIMGECWIPLSLVHCAWYEYLISNIACPLTYLCLAIIQWHLNLLFILLLPQLACQKRPSGHLVSVLSGSEASFLSSLVKSTGNSYQYIWIGLHDPTLVWFPLVCVLSYAILT